MSFHMFYGDYRYGEDPLAFLTDLETALAQLPHLSEPEKCERLYLRCRSGFDAEDWYENLEQNSPAVVTSWSTLVLHFRVKWLGASPNTLLEIPKPVTIKKTDTATPITCKTPTTTTIPAYTNTTAPTALEMTTTSEPSDRALDVRHVTATPTPVAALSRMKPTNTTATDLNNAITTVKQQDDKEPGVGREEEEKGVGKQDGASERGEQGGTGMTQGEVRDPAPSPTARFAFDAMLHEHAQFDWAAEVDEALGLSPVVPSNSTTPTPVNPVPSDVTVDPVRIAFANPVPSNLPTTPSVHPDPIPVHPAFVCAVPADPNPGDGAPNPRSALGNTVPTDLIPVEPNPNTVVSVNLNPARIVNTERCAVTPKEPTPNSRIGDTFIISASVDTAPVDFVSIEPDPVSVDPDPVVSVNPFINLLATGSTPTRIAPADPFIDFAFVGSIYSTPTNPVHVDPVSTDIFNSTAFTITTLALTTFLVIIPICWIVNITPAYWSFFSSGLLEEGDMLGLRTRTFACLGGALVIVSFAHFTCESDTATGASD